MQGEVDPQIIFSIGVLQFFWLSHSHSKFFERASLIPDPQETSPTMAHKSEKRDQWMSLWKKCQDVVNCRSCLTAKVQGHSVLCYSAGPLCTLLLCKLYTVNCTVHINSEQCQTWIYQPMRTVKGTQCARAKPDMKVGPVI